LDPEGWHIDADTEETFEQPAGEHEYTRWRKQIEARLAQEIEALLREDYGTAHAKIAKRIDRIWTRANPQGRWVRTIESYGWHVENDEIRWLAEGVRRAIKAEAEEGKSAYHREKEATIKDLGRKCGTPEMGARWWGQAGDAVPREEVQQDEIRCLEEAGGEGAGYHRSRKEQVIIVGSVTHTLEIDDEGRKLMRQIATWRDGKDKLLVGKACERWLNDWWMRCLHEITRENRDGPPPARAELNAWIKQSTG
jgi:hypothetical protein